MQCQETNADGEQCSREAQEGREYCWQHPRGEGPTSVSTEEMIDAVEKFRGGLYLAADYLDCSYNQIKDRAKTDDELARVIENEKGKIDDRAELGLVKAIQDGKSWAIKFRLKHAAERGYVEQKDVTSGGDKVDAAPVVMLPDNGKREDGHE